MGAVPKPHEIDPRELTRDTDPEAQRVQLEIYRRMSPARKLELVSDAIETARSLALAGLRQRYPQAGSEELKRRLFGLWLGEDLAAQVYGPVPPA